MTISFSFLFWGHTYRCARMDGVRCFNFGIRTPLHNRRDDDDVDANAITMDGCNRARVGSFHKFSPCTCCQWLVLHERLHIMRTILKRSHVHSGCAVHTHTHACIRSLDFNLALQNTSKQHDNHISDNWSVVHFAICISINSNEAWTWGCTREIVFC